MQIAHLIDIFLASHVFVRAVQPLEDGDRPKIMCEFVTQVSHGTSCILYLAQDNTCNILQCYPTKMHVLGCTMLTDHQ